MSHIVSRRRSIKPFLVVISLGIAIAFRMKFWNIGAEGQYYMGAFAAAYFTLNFAFLPRPILLLIMVVASLIMGGIWFPLFPGF